MPDAPGQNDKQQSPPAENPAQITAAMKDWIALTEYQLAEKIEGRVSDALKRKITLISIILGFIGPLALVFVGQILLDYTASKVKEGLEKDTSVLRDKINNQLADLALRTAELRAQAETAQNELTALRNFAVDSKKLVAEYEGLKAQGEAHSKELDSINKQIAPRLQQTEHDSEKLNELGLRLTELNKETELLTQRTSNAQISAFSAQLSNSSLSNGILSSFTGSPSIISGPLGNVQTGSLTGDNFGNTRGRIYVTFTSSAGPGQTSPVTFSNTGSLSTTLSSAGLTIGKFAMTEAVQLSEESVTRWEDHLIVYSASSGDIEKLRKLSSSLTQGASDQSSRLTEYIIQVETSTGKRSNSYTSLQLGSP